MIRDLALERWLDALAAPSATPGGGSATALIGAMAGALVAMVCGITTARDNVAADLRTRLTATQAQAEKLRRRMTALIDEDVTAFDAVMAAYALPRATAEQQAERSSAIQAALHQATLVPLACADAALSTLELCAIVSEQGHLNAIGESAVAVEAARMAFRASALNVSINLGSIRDRAFVDSQRAELARMQARFVELDGRIQELLAKRLG